MATIMYISGRSTEKVNRRKIFPRLDLAEVAWKVRNLYMTDPQQADLVKAATIRIIKSKFGFRSEPIERQFNREVAYAVVSK